MDQKPKVKLKVVVVEDDATIRLLIVNLLQNFEVIEFPSGVEAWDAINVKKLKFDLIILDRYMPVMDGIQFLEKFKAEKDLVNIPVIMLTGADSPKEIAEVSKMGVFYYLKKPVKKDIFLSVIDAAVDSLKNTNDELF